MKITLNLLFLILGYSVTAQSTNFRFKVDDQFYLRFKTNTAGYHYIEQTNTQSSLFFGFGAGANNTDVGGTNFGEFNTAFGQFTLNENTTGQRNTALGYACLDENTTGNSNVGIGFSALSNNTEGVQNVAIGDISLRDNIDGDSNIAIGHSSLTSSTGSSNIGIGIGAGLWEGLSNFNIYLGHRAGRGITSTTSDKDGNVMIGAFAGEEVSTSKNVFLGYEAGRYSEKSGGDALYIANSSADSTEALIYGEFDNDLLRVNGKLTIDGLYSLPTTAPLAGQYLRVSSAGANPTASWGSIDAPWSLEAGDDVVYEDGDVGVGIGNPIYRLDVEDAVNNGYVARFHNANTTSASKGIIIQTGANTNPTSSSYYALFLDGNGTNIGGIRGNGSGGTMYSTTSDRRLKQNIRTFTAGLETVKHIRPTQYQMKTSPEKEEIGFIAQELQHILPIAVGGNSTDDVEKSPMTVDYSRLTPVLVAAIQEQQEIIENLTKRLDEKDQQFDKLSAEIAKLQGVAQK